MKREPFQDELDRLITGCGIGDDSIDRLPNGHERIIGHNTYIHIEYPKLIEFIKSLL